MSLVSDVVSIPMIAKQAGVLLRALLRSWMSLAPTILKTYHSFFPLGEANTCCGLHSGDSQQRSEHAAALLGGHLQMAVEGPMFPFFDTFPFLYSAGEPSFGRGVNSGHCQQRGWQAGTLF